VFVPWFTPEWKVRNSLPIDAYHPGVLRYAFEKAVVRHTMSDVP
jgi:hypothetical protein